MSRERRLGLALLAAAAALGPLGDFVLQLGDDLLRSFAVSLASFGAADFPSCTTLEELVACADQRLYEAKRRGKNQVVGDPEVETSVVGQSTVSI